MKAKNIRVAVELKAEGDPGAFVATFSTLNVIDRDGDVTVPGAFKDGQAVRISAWGHNWGALPVGKGTIRSDDERAWVEGQFFLDTAHGEQTYRTVKNLGELQEWSYGFDVLAAEPGTFDGRDVRFLRGLDVFEVSPVMIGAGVDTRTDQIKTAKTGRRNSAADRERLAAVRRLLRDATAKLDELEDDEDDGEAAANPKANGDEPKSANPDEPKEMSVRANAVRLEVLELASP